MDLLKQLQDLIALVASFPDQLVAEKKASYDEGFAAGAAAGGIDKIYSQAELDAKVAEAVAAVQLQLDAVKAELEQLKGEVDLKIASALSAFKADLLAKYQEQQVVESASETGFADLLK